MGLIFIVALTLLLIPVVLLTTGWIRVVLGLLFLLFFPGYTLIAAVFPRKDSLDPMERVALSFASSIAVVIAIGLILNYTPLGINLYTVTASIAIFILVAAAIAIWLRRRLPIEERFHVLPRVESSKWSQLNRLEKALSIILVLSILVGTGALVYVMAVPRQGEKFTEFYIPAAGDYPTRLAIGEPLTVTLHIASQEHESTSYHVQARVDSEVVEEKERFTLTHGEARDETVTIVPTKSGRQEIEFLLYKHKDGGTELYRTANLSITVEETTS
ncbi:MAG: DUF1616 domain-containing protein [Dehalococcoidia bacterium]|nr:DUF1616 domain-containing protein [Dehalococcoidia bacterium]